MEKSYNKEAAMNPDKGVMQEKEEPKMSQQDQAYIGGLMKMLHSKKTAPVIDEMLQSGDPAQTIPEIALMVNQQMETEISKKSAPPSLETLLQAGVYLVSDLIEIGNAGGFFDIRDEQQVQPILQNTLQTYIERGLKNGTVDPIELQAKVEPLMSEESRNIAMQAAQKGGLPEAPDETTRMEVYGKQMERKGMLKGGA